MVIISATGQVFDTGTLVGIGINPPLHQLDVAGDVNLATGSRILIGGRSVVSTLGTGNTFIGDLTGTSITTGYNQCLHRL